MRDALAASWIAVASLALTPAASASITYSWVQNPITPQAIAEVPELANMQSWSIIVHTSGDWTSAGLRMILPAGHQFWHHPFAGNTRPDPAMVALFPAMAFDTYVTGPGDTGTSGAPAILGGHPVAQFPNPDFGGQVFSVSWGNVTVDPAGSYEIVRATWPLGVFPAIPVPNLPDASFTAQVNPDGFVIIEVPEPGASALLAGLVVAALLRRR